MECVPYSGGRSNMLVCTTQLSLSLFPHTHIPTAALSVAVCAVWFEFESDRCRATTPSMQCRGYAPPASVPPRSSCSRTSTSSHSPSSSGPPQLCLSPLSLTSCVPLGRRLVTASSSLQCRPSSLRFLHPRCPYRSLSLSSPTRSLRFSGEHPCSSRGERCSAVSAQP